MSPCRVSPAEPQRVVARSLTGVLRVTCLAAFTLLTACASAPQPVAIGLADPPPLPEAARALFDDARFAPATVAIDPADVFRMSPEMTQYLNESIEPMARDKGVRVALTEALYSRNQLQLEYESSLTRNAAQAFSSRQGNCLSLVIMTAAFAEALGVKVTFQQVTTSDELWSRAGDMYVMSGHVNLLLGRRYSEIVSKFDTKSSYVIDFMPGNDAELRAHPISERTVLAMYMNNRAAESMVRNRIDDAYWLARQAIQLDSRFLSAYNTLAVIYMRHGNPADAQKTLRYALDAAPDNARLLANYVEALHELGREGEAQVAQAHLNVVEPTPPFYWFKRGEAALKAGDAESARQLFLKEIDRSPDYHEFHYALAVAYFDLGRMDEARHELGIAVDDAIQRTDHDLYAAKLDKLSAQRHKVSAPVPPNMQ